MGSALAILNSFPLQENTQQYNALHLKMNLLSTERDPPDNNKQLSRWDICVWLLSLPSGTCNNYSLGEALSCFSNYHLQEVGVCKEMVFQV